MSKLRISKHVTSSPKFHSTVPQTSLSKIVTVFITGYNCSITLYLITCGLLHQVGLTNNLLTRTTVFKNALFFNFYKIIVMRLSVLMLNLAAAIFSICQVASVPFTHVITLSGFKYKKITKSNNEVTKQ